MQAGRGVRQVIRYTAKKILRIGHCLSCSVKRHGLNANADTGRALDLGSVKLSLVKRAIQAQGGLMLEFGGYSMMPSIRPGNTLKVVKASPDTLTTGDVIAFLAGRRIVVHRIVGLKHGWRKWYFVTKGDNCQVEDSLVAPHQVLGIVCKIQTGALGPELSSSVTTSTIGGYEMDHQARPVAKPGVICRKEDADGVLFDHGTGSAKILNSVGLIVWGCCDGSWTLSSIIDMVHKRFLDVPRETISADVDKFVMELEELEFLSIAEKELSK